MRASLKVSLSAIVALSMAAPALAQDSRKPTGSGSSTGGSAVSRGGGSSSGGSSSGGSSSTSSGGSSGGSSVSSGGYATPRGGGESRPNREPQASGRRSSGDASGGGPVIPAYSRPRGDRSVRGEAIDRGNNPLPPRGGNGNYYYYDPYYYGFNRGPYGYNYNRGWYTGWGYPIYTGFGWVYFDPYWGYYDPFYSRGYYAYGPHGTRYRDKDDRDYDIGSIRLKVDQRKAEVFVDGLYRGIVDDFDGVFQRLKLEAGAHRMEIRLAGYQPLVFDVLVTPGETTTYRGNLRR